ncbi:MAG: hypothetical protein ACXQTS_02785 [Candidatus Methanospirareceae archaeon]
MSQKLCHRVRNLDKLKRKAEEEGRPEREVLEDAIDEYCDKSLLEKIRRNPPLLDKIVEDEKMFEKLRKEVELWSKLEEVEMKRVERERKKIENKRMRIENERMEIENQVRKQVYDILCKILSEKIEKMSKKELAEYLMELEYKKVKAWADAILEREPKYAKYIVSIFYEEVSQNGSKRKVHLISSQQIV